MDSSSCVHIISRFSWFDLMNQYLFMSIIPDIITEGKLGGIYFIFSCLVPFLSGRVILHDDYDLLLFLISIIYFSTDNSRMIPVV
jgi:hypothetical protein